MVYICYLYCPECNFKMRLYNEVVRNDLLLPEKHTIAWPVLRKICLIPLITLSENARHLAEIVIQWLQYFESLP